MEQQYSRSGIPLQQVYTPENTKDLDYERDLNTPGAFPYTRGRRIVTNGGWLHRELSGEGDPAKSNEQIKYLIEKGQMGIDVIGDSPTQACLDADHPLAAKTCGTQGVSLCCLLDYRELFKGLPLESISVSSSVPPAFAVAALYLVAKERGLSANKLRGSVVQPPFYCEDCGYSLHMPFSLRLRMTTDSIEFCSVEMPKFHSFLEDTYFISEAGLDAVEEMALGFIEIRHVVRSLLKKGLDIDSFAPRIAILVNCGMDFFENIAKIRATRRLFAKMMKTEFGAKDSRSLSVVITSHTSGLSLTAQQPSNNIVRGTIQSLALVLAGVQAIEISGFDEAYRTPSRESHLIGLRTQQVIHLESNITKVSDPLGGSYFLESLTNDIEKRIWDLVSEIEGKGDPSELSDKGFFKDLINSAMERYARQVGNGELLKVGHNIHQIPDEEDKLLKDVAQTKIEPCYDHIEKVRRHKKERNQDEIESVLRQVYHQVRSEGVNVMYPIIDALETGATVGEIAGIMRLAYGFPYDPHNMIDYAFSRSFNGTD